MSTSFAALIFRPAEIPDRALAQGFAVALGGWDVPSPRLLVAPLPGLAGWSVAFYSGGPALDGEDELEHWCDLFDEELSPAACVLDAAAELGHPDGLVYALIFSDDLLHDEALRLDAVGFARHFVREGEEGLEAGVETVEQSKVELLDFDANDAQIAPHRGSAFLAAELGAPVLPALVSALFAADRRVVVRLVDPDPEAIREETERLVGVLKRTPGRGAFALPEAAGVPAPAAARAFAERYDWADPQDPEDLYRGLSIGAIEGVLRFLREEEILGRAGEPRWAEAARKGMYPLARLAGSALGGGQGEAALIALDRDGATLFVVKKDGRPRPAGPTLGELLRYLSLGWSKRSDPEEDLIGALMLRAKIVREKRA